MTNSNVLIQSQPQVSQKVLIKRHMEKCGSITQLEATELYRVHRLASRIHDLRKDGVLLVATTKQDVTGRPYSSYSLANGSPV